MDNWILKGPQTLVNEPHPEQAVAADEVKVKVAYVLASTFDTALYSGDVQAQYPKTIGRFAVGRVTEAGENCYGIEKNMRVLLNPTRNCGHCPNCRAGRPEKCTNIAVAGRDFDGFLRDFAVCKYNEVSPLPDSVSDIKALFTEYVALAECVYDRLALTPGNRVAVVGSNFLGNVIAQVLQYHKLIPITIDSSPQAAERARSSGIYYSFISDDDVIENIKEATSGQMCDASVYTTCSRMDPSLTMRVLAYGKSAILAGCSPISFNIPSRDVIEKDAALSCVMNGFEYTDTAMNLLVHDAVNCEIFERDILTTFDPREVYKTMAETGNKNGRLTIFKMIL